MASSDTELQLEVTNIQLSNYSALLVLVAVGYDYVLTFSDEIEYIWNKHWTRVSTLFVLARYFGLCSAMINAFGVFETSFRVWGLTEPMFLKTGVRSYLFLKGCGILVFLATWAQLTFICAADVIMILRVWALYSRSKFIFCALLTLCAIANIPYLVFCITLSTHDGPIVNVGQVLDFSFCEKDFPVPVWTLLVECGQITLGAIMCVLVAIRFIGESLQMYNATKRFYLNCYMNLLLREGFPYFLVVLAYALIGMLVYIGKVSANGWRAILFAMLNYIPPYTLVARFNLSLRRAYARDLRGRCGSEIDMAFGLESGSDTTAGISAIMFMDSGGNQASNQGEEVDMEER